MRQYHKGRLRETPQSRIWRKPEKTRRGIVDSVCHRLLASFGKPRLGNPRDPVDDLVFLMLSNRTQFDTAKRVFQSLKEIGSWDVVSCLRVRTLEGKIQIAGLAKKRSQQMKQTLRQIRDDFGRCTLDQLRSWDEQTAHAYLVKLPGVSDKVAKCVMMYTLGFKVLPVDVHVFRVSSRLGCPLGFTCIPVPSAVPPTAPLPNAPPPVITPFTFIRSLEAGKNGPDVTTLQQYLNSKGYTVSSIGPGSPGHETTLFGPKTKAALIRFQRDHGIPATGFFGPVTRGYVREHP